MSDNNEFRDNSNRGGRPSGNKPSGGSGRGGYQKGRPSGDRRNDRGRSDGFEKKPYRKDGDRNFNRDDSEKKFDRGDRSRKFDGEKKFDRDDRPRRFDGDKKFDRDDRPRRFDDGKKFDRGDRPRKLDDEKKFDRPYGDRKGGGRSFDRDNGDRKPFRKDGERKPYREDGERKPYRDGEKRGEFADKRCVGDERGRGFERRDNERNFDRRDFDDKSEGRGGVGRERKFDHFDGERRPPRRDDSKGFERRDGERGFDRNRSERKFEDGEKRFERRESAGPRGGEDRRGGDPKFAAGPKDQARKGYQGRKGRADGHCASPARQAALTVVAQLRRRDAFAQDLISKYIDKSTMSPEDRAFATRLVLGVVTTRGTLDDILNRCMNSPEDVSPEVRDALHISAYEIMFLDKEAHAAVDQGVELVRSVAPKASGVGNAVLRKLVTIKDQFPFGDPQRELSAYARQHAFPEWLAKELVETFGPDGAHAFMEACNDPAPVFVGINAAKDGEDVYQTLAAAKGEPEAASVGERVIPGCYKINSGQILTDGRIKRLINNGHMLVSDLASQAVADLILPEQKPSSMLEIGAGRATKTVLIQSNSVRRWGSQIEEYVTLDNHEFKTKLLQERSGQYGINVTEAVTGDATDLDATLEGRMFDVIFIDAPCTGLGTLRRHPEIRWRLKPETIDEYSELGLAMLKQAASHVNAGGTLAYATCTVTRKENSGVIKAFLESPEGAEFRLVPVDGKAAFVSELTPGGSDAHFAAKMVKLG